MKATKNKARNKRHARKRAVGSKHQTCVGGQDSMRAARRGWGRGENKLARNKGLCPICEEGYLQPIVAKNDIGDGLVVDCYFSECSACGCEQADAKQTRINKQIAIEAREQHDRENKQLEDAG